MAQNDTCVSPALLQCADSASSCSNSSSTATLNHQRRILNAMFPPQQQSQLSLERASRVQVLALAETFEAWLETQQARGRPLCPIRERALVELLDELVRGITLENPERGLLLFRVRDEARLSIHAYQTLARDSIDFPESGFQSCDQLVNVPILVEDEEPGTAEAANRMTRIQQDIQTLRRHRDECQRKLRVLTSEAECRREAQASRHAQVVELLTQQNTVLEQVQMTLVQDGEIPARELTNNHDSNI